MSIWHTGEVVIEVGGDRNQYFYFRPLNCKLRGAYSTINVKSVSSNTEFGNMPDIPGIQVGLDVDAKMLRAADPLGFPEYSHVLAEANRIRKEWIGEGRAWDTMVARNLSQSEIKTALWYMAELVWAKKAKVVQGELPDRKAILKMPGDLRIRWGRQVRGADGKLISPFASKEEIEKLAEGPGKGIEYLRPGSESMNDLQVMDGGGKPEVEHAL